MGAENARGATASGPAGVDILPLPIEQEQSAVGIVVAERVAALGGQFPRETAPDEPEIAGHDLIVVLRLRSSIIEKVRQRVGSGRCKCQG